MHFVRLAVISFIVLLLLVTGISLMIPQHMRISRAVSINAPKDSVLVYIRDVEKWRTWYPGLDSAKPLFIAGKIEGYIMDDSDSLHPVYIVVTGEKEKEINAQFISPKLNPVVNGWVVEDGPTPGTTSLQWYMNFHLHWYPWEKFASLTLERTYGSPMEQGLANIKRNVEN